jgi:protoporphyrinogen oxidase
MGETIIIGAGPAGLAAAYELVRGGRHVRTVEKDELVGGISRTVNHRGYRIDIGGHRFFTKVPEIQDFWEEMLGDDFLERPRLSRIFYRNRFFDYPLKPINALRGLGPWEALRVGASYLRARVVPHPDERSFEEWVANRFGQRLYEIFFKTYTEKVWGIPCSEISADWAAQRIKNLDLVKAVRNALLGSRGGGEVITTLIDRFHYPRLGPGMMWERCVERLAAMGAPVELRRRAAALHHRDGRITAVDLQDSAGEVESIEVDQVISSMPLQETIRTLDPPPPAEILAAADRLRYRDFLIILVIVDRPEVFPDNWIYVHSPDVVMGRIQNFKNWSPEMVPDPAMTSLGLEYFVNVGDELWTAEDGELVELGVRELATLGLVEETEVVDGAVVRMPKAYPVYDGNYRDSVATLREYLGEFANLQVIGRNGQHRYNNQDHSMLSGIRAAQNVVGDRHDVWAVNVEGEYLEEDRRAAAAAAGRMVPQPVAAIELEELLRRAFARYDPLALGLSLGTVFGVGLFLATAVLLVKGGDPIGPNLSLLGVYLLGFEVTWTGAVVGALEAAALGLGLGAALAWLINGLVGFYEQEVRRELELAEIMDPLEVVDQ